MKTNPNPSTILFDFDKTLLNTSNWVQSSIVPKLAAAHQTQESKIYAAIDEYRATLDKYTEFSHVTLVPFLVKQLQFEAETTEKILLHTPAIQDHVYPDVASVLGQLQAEYQLGIFSEAESEWQQAKLEATGLKPYFQSNLIFIFDRKETAEAVEQLPHPCSIIDDNPDVIEYLLRFDGIHPIWLNRRSKQRKKHVPTIQSLLELPTVLRQLDQNTS